MVQVVLPNGKIVVFTGILPMAKNEQGLAAIPEPRPIHGAKTRMVADAKAGKLGAVVFLKQDRLGRSTYVVASTVKELLEASAIIVSVQDGYDTTRES